ncbi:MAG: tyrosine-type recombinase/integrase [Luteibacter sp.]
MDPYSGSTGGNAADHAGSGVHRAVFCRPPRRGGQPGLVGPQAGRPRQSHRTAAGHGEPAQEPGRGCAPQPHHPPSPHLVRLLLELRAERGGKHAKEPVFIGETGHRLAPDSITQASSRACRRAGVEGARLHDLRHTRITELGHALKNPLQVAAISGHDDLGVLKRYFNATAEDLATVLNRLEGKERRPLGLSPGPPTASPWTPWQRFPSGRH